jgi:tRNA pseudouridine13 synthase
MSVHPRSDGDSHHHQQDSKRPRLDETASSSHSVISLHRELFNSSSSTGLFNVLAPTLGFKPAEEPQVGITEFVDSKSKSFSGIIKHRSASQLSLDLYDRETDPAEDMSYVHRFTDFLVYEIGLDGQVVRLKDIKGPIPNKKQKRDNKKPEEITTKQAGLDEKKQQVSRYFIHSLFRKKKI